MAPVLDGKFKKTAKRRAPVLEKQKSGQGPRYSPTQGFNLLQISTNWFLGNWTRYPRLKWAKLCGPFFISRIKIRPQTNILLEPNEMLLLLVPPALVAQALHSFQHLTYSNLSMPQHIRLAKSLLASSGLKSYLRQMGLDKLSLKIMQTISQEPILRTTPSQPKASQETTLDGCLKTQSLL